MTHPTGRFSDQVKATHAGLELVFHFEDPGFYFMPISEGIINRRTEHLIRGFFLSIGGSFSGLESDPVTSTPIDPELLEFIKNPKFSDEFQDIPILLDVLLVDEGEARFRYVQKESDTAGGEVPDDNLTFHQLYRLLCLVNDLLHSRDSICGFVFDGARLDERMIGKFLVLLQGFRERIEKAGNVSYFFFSDTPYHSFSKAVLYESREFRRIGKIVQEGVVPFAPFSFCCESLTRIARIALKSRSPLIFFLGAGASIAAGMPSGDDILEYALKELLQAEYTDRERAIREVLRKLGNPAWLTPSTVTSEHVISLISQANDNYLHTDTFTWIRENDQNAKPTEAHRILVDYCLRQSRSIIVTTNFDTIVERVGPDLVKTIFREQEFKDKAELKRGQIFDFFASQKAVGLVKLHGSLDGPQTIAMKIGQLEGLSPAKSVFWDRLFEPLEEEPFIPVLAVGYGFHDPDLLSRFAELGRRGFQVIVISREPTWRMWEIAGQPAKEGARGMICSVNFETLGTCLKSAWEDS